MANGLYSRDEIACMTDDALDELAQYYSDTANVEGLLRVTDEQGARQDDLEAEREAELAHDAAEAKAQRMHDEMVDSMYADGLIS